jgi:diguanylate cyclase (GGDEF)-like protein
MGNDSSRTQGAHNTLSRIAIYSVLLSWVLLGLYVSTVTWHEGLNLDVLKYFVSVEQSGIRFRALVLLAPFFLTVMAYLINKEARLLHQTLLAEKELRRRTSELEALNEILTRESKERENAEEQLSRQALHDSLTDLPNRSLFMDRLQAAIEHTKRYPDYVFAVFFLDVDRFKVINDGLGHLVGDQLLIATAQRLSQCVRNIDTVSRFGGDEFAILMENVTDASQAGKLADRIQKDMQLPFNVLGREIFATVSMGVVMSSVTTYRHPEELIRDADTAMYRAKANGRACHVVFDSTMHAEARSVLWLETDLRKALANNEFIVHYQPIISMYGNRLIGFEALVRWQHPTRGLYQPLDFLTIAEETGLIIPIGRWVIRESCRQLRQWHEQFPEYRELTVSVNVSGKVFSQPDFYDEVVTTLRETGLEPHSLRLEIVERTLIENPEPAAVVVKKLRDLNVRIDIDDFGVGYSALNYLRHFPIHGLKIDRAFVSALTTDKSNAAIVKTIIALSRDLSLDVTAEGIETTEQMEAYRAMQGGYAQGFFISKPLESATIEDVLRGKNSLVGLAEARRSGVAS